jgi:hypothetical protein
VIALNQVLAPLLLARRRAVVQANLAGVSHSMPAVMSPEPDTRESWAWVAGLIEGAGWILPAPTGRRRSPIVAAESTDRDVLERLVRLAGAGSIMQINRHPGTWKPSGRWSVSNRSDVQRIVTATLPLFGERRSVRARQIRAR